MEYQTFNHDAGFLIVCVSKYAKCRKILYTKVTDKMVYTNSADSDQTAPGAV